MEISGKKIRSSYLTDSVMRLINLILVAVTLFSYAVPWVFPKYFPQLSVLSIFLPFFLMLNTLMVLYWVLRRKKWVILSLGILMLGYQYIGRFVRFYDASPQQQPSDITVMTFNVRIFNRYRWNPDKQTDAKILNFIREKNPDVLVIQEFYRSQTYEMKQYPYRYISYKTASHNVGQAIFSKFPIVNQGSLQFPKTSNNAVYADLKIHSDTIRVYNLHLESLHINPEEQEISQENSRRLVNHIGKQFAIQQSQVEIYRRHQLKNPYKSVVCGDFNNTAFSYVYRQIRTDRLCDSFEAAGVGFGKTFHFPYFPFRIDYILIDKRMTITSHRVFPSNYSDHNPVMASFRI